MSSMLSGFTSQLGTLIGNKSSKDKENVTGTTAEGGDTQQQPISTPPNPQDTTQPTTATGTGTPGSETSVLSSVRNHIPSWLGGSKVGKEDEASGVKEGDQAAPQPPSSSGGITPDKESDASSATGGADSDNQASEGEAEGDKGGLEKVKNLGNLLFSTIKGAGQKIKETSILGDFQREHDSFLKSKGGKSEAVPPWIGSPKEDALKEEILSLSNDRRNFVRSPPSGVSFTWDWEEMAPVARATLKEDPNLESMRYQLVPKVITEENFWRNYFYRVSLLKESMSDEEPKTRAGGREPLDSDYDDALEKELNEELRSFEVVGGSSSAGVDDREIDALLDLK